MAIIAFLDIILGARTDKMDAGLDRAGAKVNKFRGDLINRLPGGGFITQAASTLGSFGPVGLAAAGAVAAIGTAAVGTGIAIAGIREQMGAIDDIAKQASSAGVAFRELAAFQFAAGEAGVGPDAAAKGLAKLQINLSEAATKGGDLDDKLSALGLNSANLLKAGPIEAMKQLSAATVAIKDPADQLLLAYKLFGKEGVAILNVLKAGPEAMQEQVAVAERLGLTLSDAQAKQVEAANDSWGRVQLIATGVFRQIAAESASVMTAIADSIDATGEKFRGWNANLSGVVDTLTYAAAIVYDIVELSSVFRTVLGKIIALDFSGIGESVQSAFDFSTGDKWLASLNAARDSAARAPKKGSLDVTALEAQAEAQKAAAETAKRTAEERDRAEQRGRDSVSSRLAGMRDEIATLRMGAEAVERMKLARQGATAAQIAGFDAMTREKSRLEDLDTAMQRGIALREQFATPTENLQKEMTDLRGLLDVGAIDFGTFANAAREAAGRLGKQDEKKHSEAAPSFGALQKGSVEAFSAALRNEKAGSQQKLQQEGNKLLAAINTGIAQMNQNRPATIGNAG
jgi:hypothetical protein